VRAIESVRGLWMGNLMADFRSLGKSIFEAWGLRDVVPVKKVWS